MLLNVEQIINAINRSVASSRFSSLRLLPMFLIRSPYYGVKIQKFEGNVRPRTGHEGPE